MPINPCRQCQMLDQDKNNAVCLKCDKRLRYVASLETLMSYPVSTSEEIAFCPLNGQTGRLFA